jgi:hypothetical protein
MTKTHICISIDSDLIEKAKHLQINMSGEFQRFIENAIAIQNNDIEGLNLQLINIDIVRLQNQKFKTDLELQNLLKKKEVVGAAIKKQEEEKLRNEKEAIQALEKCQCCGDNIAEGMKKHKFAVGYICNSCFIGAGGKEFKKWNNE